MKIWYAVAAFGFLLAAYSIWDVRRARRKILVMLLEDPLDSTAGVELARHVGSSFYVAAGQLAQEGLVDRIEGAHSGHHFHARGKRPRYYYKLTQRGAFAAVREQRAGQKKT